MDSKISSVSLQNFGAIPALTYRRFTPINVIIGENGTGKSFLLKALYTAIRAMEEYRKGDDILSFREILAQKLRWTFQADSLGDLITRSAVGSQSAVGTLTFEMTCDNTDIRYRLSAEAENVLSSVTAPAGCREGNSVLIPAKEVLSLYSVILKSREMDKVFGFDDTYYDLARALRISPERGGRSSAFADSRKNLKAVMDGSVELEESTGKWFYENSRNQRFSMGTTSEGVKKISILDRLLSNGYLDSHSVIFIDEIEAALHPAAICDFLDMLQDIARTTGIQFFISTHSYFVIKKLALLAHSRPEWITCISLEHEAPPTICDLHDGLPDNSIIETSIRLYEQEIEEAL